MGRHSRKGPAPEAADTTPGGAADARGPAAGPGRRRRPGPVSEHSGPAAGGTPAHGVPQVRGGHPQQDETGGGRVGPAAGGRYGDWQGVPRDRTAATGERRPGEPPAAVSGRAAAETGHAPASPPGAPRPPIGAGARIPGPRREFVEAFDPPPPGDRAQGAGIEPGGDEPLSRPARGRTVTGVAAAAVTTVLAVVVAGQVGDQGTGAAAPEAAEGSERVTEDETSRSDQRARPTGQATPSAPAPPAYAQLMARQFPFDPELKGPGKFDAVPGLDQAPGEGRKVRYRVDVEQGLGLDGALFADAVQQTLNDERSWAHGGAMSFERISSGEPEFVITLASPGTTAVWCAKSGLDTTVDNVSCDSASTERVMINAYRWARGAETYGAGAMLSYRQMLINHEVGHRLGHGHVNCRTSGALAPVMQQQTKSLDIGGITCRPNPWVHPGG
ncbi:DUF3152 domain-containing protein [Streptomyces pacificus]|uniref:DUF3152 domain-containing protein n=1 Tax=Streptomyces pacificus TaxID=2705029 RepID=A0A6A0AZ56_9ACTN|nr:DUF3152 domain-containing protein [Streptomyces pacificus]GFH37703.1 DUF3152 domain-containing protein [Streptomyces pacificus]